MWTPDRVRATPRRKATIVVVGADVQLCALLSELLAVHGHSAGPVREGAAGEIWVGTSEFDLVLMVLAAEPEELDALRRIRSRTRIPVLAIAASSDEAERIAALESGADDCLAKPFNPRELLLRIDALLRRSRGRRPGEPARLEVGHVILDAVGCTVRIGDRRIRLTNAEARLLEALMQNAGRLVSRGDLTEYALGRALAPFDRSLDTHVRALRCKLGVDVHGETPIKTLRGAGYLFAPYWEPPPPVPALEPEPAAPTRNEAVETLG